MYLTSVSNLKLSKEAYAVIDTMSSRAKALYNSSLYQLNKHYNETKKYLVYNKLDLLMKKLEDDNGKIVYKSLPSTLSQQTLMKLNTNYKSFFALLKMKNTKEYDKQINTPMYLKKDSRKELIYTKSETSQSFVFKNGYIYITVSKDLNKGRLKLCKIPKYIEDKPFSSIKYLEIIPKLGRYELHIKYEVQEKELNSEAKNWFSIDLGMNNLCTVTSNCTNAFIMNGKGIKSINQKYNKRIALLKSKAKKSNELFTTKQIKTLYNTRGYKLNNEIHKITDFIIKSIVSNNVDHIVIGYNKEWKDSIKLGKKTNQNFVQIPFTKILHQLEYKARLLGIEVFLQEESYTSKCSYLDNEVIKRHTTYKGNRIKRGLFTTSKGILINSDVNGSLNIYRKFISKNIQEKEVYDVLNIPVDTGFVMNPIKIHLYTNSSIDVVNTCLRSL